MKSNKRANSNSAVPSYNSIEPSIYDKSDSCISRSRIRVNGNVQVSPLPDNELAEIPENDTVLPVDIRYVVRHEQGVIGAISRRVAVVLVDDKALGDTAHLQRALQLGVTRVIGDIAITQRTVIDLRLHPDNFLVIGVPGHL